MPCLDHNFSEPHQNRLSRHKVVHALMIRTHQSAAPQVEAKDAAPALLCVPHTGCVLADTLWFLGACQERKQLQPPQQWQI